MYILLFIFKYDSLGSQKNLCVILFPMHNLLILPIWDHIFHLSLLGDVLDFLFGNVLDFN